MRRSGIISIMFRIIHTAELERTKVKMVNAFTQMAPNTLSMKNIKKIKTLHNYFLLKMVMQFYLIN
jgi:hypothetical protein